jgi:hypothetical protein
LVRWRYFFSQRLGFRWIPNSADDEGPIDERADNDNLQSGDDVRQWLRQVKRTQAWLAEMLSYMLGQPVARQRIHRLVSGRLRNPKLLTLVNDIRKVLAEDSGT